ncbi:nucleotidyltransferase domain-containing protein [Agromyces sp. NPDC058110]|uniref:nucleotidyltransferase domain-containing protein n=1 Tax=Agromyces sp. NPDC058110 TaxID=3346345 RepID=UPI0036DA37DE
MPHPADRTAAPPEVMPVAEARAGLSSLLRRFRADDAASPVVIGSHRKPEAVLVPFSTYESLTTRRTGYVDLILRDTPLLDEVRSRKRLIERLARANRVGRVQVFGSVARGEATADSDIDFLVAPDDDASLFDLAQFESDLEALFGREVDVVSRRALDDARDAELLASAVDL